MKRRRLEVPALAVLLAIAMAGGVIAELTLLASIRGLIGVVERSPIVVSPDVCRFTVAQGDSDYEIITITNISTEDVLVNLSTSIVGLSEDATPEELTAVYSINWVPLGDINEDGMQDIELVAGESVELELTVTASWTASPGEYALKTLVERTSYLPPPIENILLGNFEDNSYDYWTAGTAPVGQPVNLNATVGSWSFAYQPPAGFPPDGQRMMLWVSAEEGPMRDNDRLVAAYLRSFTNAKWLRLQITMDNTEWDLGTEGWVNLLEAVIIQNDANSWQQINIPTGVKEWNGASGIFSFNIDLSGIAHSPEGDEWVKLILVPMYGNVTTAGNFYFDNIWLIV